MTARQQLRPIIKRRSRNYICIKEILELDILISVAVMIGTQTTFRIH